MNARRASAALAGLIVLALVAGACGGASSSPAGSTASQAPASQPAASTASQGTASQPASGAPVEGDTLTISVGGDPLAIDAALIRSGFGTQVSLLMAETLTTYKNTGKLEGLLATSWEPNATADAWTFHLKDGVKFHDGTPFNAAAVKANIDRLIDPKVKALTSNDVGAFTKSVDVKDDMTVVFNLKQPVGYFPDALSNQTSAFSSPASWTQNGNTYEDASKVVATGPYKLVEWVKDDHLTLTRNDDYWGKKPNYKTQIFRFIPDANARETALRAGEVQIVTGIQPANLASIDADPNLETKVNMGTRVNYMAFNTVSTVNPKLQDPKVRQALNYAVDRKAIVDKVLFGAGSAATAPVVDPAFGWCAMDDPYAYDPAKAKSLLAEAGASDLAITIITPNGRFLQDSATAQAVAGYLTDVGVKVTGPQVQDNAANQAIITAPADKAATDPLNQLFIWSFGADFPHSSQYLGRLFASTGGLNFSHYKNSKVDDLNLKAAAEPDATKAADLYCQANKQVWTDAPHLWLYTAGLVVAQSSAVTGVTVTPNNQLNTIYAQPAS